MCAGLREAANGTEAHEEPGAKMGGEGWVIRLQVESLLARLPEEPRALPVGDRWLQT